MPGPSKYSSAAYMYTAVFYPNTPLISGSLWVFLGCVHTAKPTLYGFFFFKFLVTVLACSRATGWTYSGVTCWEITTIDVVSTCISPALFNMLRALKFAFVGHLLVSFQLWLTLIRAATNNNFQYWFKWTITFSIYQLNLYRLFENRFKCSRKDDVLKYV